jgi:FtsP/CotA-like multicopper oxidase with cupredoxin domain
MRTVPAAFDLSAAVILFLGGCASTSSIALPDVPAQLRPPPGQVLFLEAQATGVQIYDCSAKADQASSYEWTFRAPEAVLKDSSGRVLGRHFAGPTWEFKDGSSVVGDVQARAPSPSPTAIPWLLLTAKTTTGSGKLTATTSVERLQTVGGIAPSVGCDASSGGKVAQVPYTATYYFYRSAP